MASSSSGTSTRGLKRASSHIHHNNRRVDITHDGWEWPEIPEPLLNRVQQHLEGLEAMARLQHRDGDHYIQGGDHPVLIIISDDEDEGQSHHEDVVVLPIVDEDRRAAHPANAATMTVISAHDRNIIQDYGYLTRAKNVSELMCRHSSNRNV